MRLPMKRGCSVATVRKLKPKAPKSLPASKPQTLKLSVRRTPELVIALVGAAGAGVTSVGDAFAKQLRDEFGYEPHIVKVSDLIRAQAAKIGKEIDPRARKAKQIESMQDVGNELRHINGSDYLAKLSVERIAEWRVKKQGYQGEGNGLGAALPKRWVHIVNEVKHPEEVRMLRDVYGDLFWLVAVLADKESLKRGLVGAQVTEVEAAAIIRRDENEAAPDGQKVRDTVQLADYFVRNDPDHKDKLEGKALSFLDLIFNIRVATPTADEAGMSKAFSAAANSACLSRQVGAAAYSNTGELLGVGWNDVPRFGGGLYSFEDGANDNRCFRWGGGICHNDSRKDKLHQQIIGALKDSNILREGVIDDEVVFALRTTDIRSLIEYSRSVHAEMAAILSVARTGELGLIDGTLYVTTFPCHSCARHIVAAGIKKVIYIEPYPKSLATELHYDALFSGFSEDKKSKVQFVPYEGLAPRNIYRLFKHGIERKEQGKARSQNRKTAEPVTRPPLDGFTVFEQVVVKELTTLSA